MTDYDPTRETLDSASGGTLTAESGASSPDTEAGTVADAMRQEEVARARIMVLIGYPISAAVLASLPLLSGDLTLKLVLTGAVLFANSCGTWVYVILRDPTRYTTRMMTSFSLVVVVAANIGVAFWGVFSAGPTLIVIGIYFFSRTESMRAALLIYGANASLQAILAVLILGGVMSDPGMFPAPDYPVYELAITQGLIQVMYVSAYWIARMSRASTLEAIDKLQRATRVASQRQALLHEAQQDLDRALQVGGPGRYTERMFGDYKLGVVIGRGAMGEVYEASRPEDGELAAVKLLHPHVLEDRRQVIRFLREAQAVGALRSAHVVRVFESSKPDAPLPYLVMERLHGHDLAHLVRQKQHLSVGKIVELVRQVGGVVDAAREKAIVHRDLKPQNLFLAEQSGGKPVWKVLDFGVATLGEHSGTLTQGHVVGTPAYMAPEQAAGESVDHRTDLYALAAVCYRCLTGRPAFSGKDVPTLLYRVVHTMPDRPSAVRPSLPADVDSVLAIGLAKSPDDRFDSGAELADALAAAGAGRLDPALRDRARALLAGMPWGAKRVTPAVAAAL